MQHVNYKWRMSGVDTQTAERDAGAPEKIAALARQEIAAERLRPPPGVVGPPAAAFPWNPVAGRLWLTYWEIEKVDPTDPVAVSRCLAACQVAALDVVRFCRTHVPGYENCRVEALPGLLGTRESRRILGKYVLTGEDVKAGRKFDDGIARCCFFADLHDSPPGLTMPDALSNMRRWVAIESSRSIGVRRHLSTG